MNDNLTPNFKKKFEEIINSHDEKNFLKLMGELIMHIDNFDDAKFIAELILSLKKKFDDERQINIKNQVKNKVDTDKKALIMDYDDRYFLECTFSKQDLFDMQEQIMLQIESNSQDIAKDVKELTKVSYSEIEICLRQAYSKGLIKREQIDIEEDVSIYRYFSEAKNE